MMLLKIPFILGQYDLKIRQLLKEGAPEESVVECLRQVDSLIDKLKEYDTKDLCDIDDFLDYVTWELSTPRTQVAEKLQRAKQAQIKNNMYNKGTK